MQATCLVALDRHNRPVMDEHLPMSGADEYAFGEYLFEDTGKYASLSGSRMGS